MCIEAYSDSFWAWYKMKKRSKTGFFITINQTPVNWKSRIQSIIILSFTKAEYVALSMTAEEITWLPRLFWETRYQQQLTQETVTLSISLLADNTVVLAVTDRLGLSARTKQIKFEYHHTRHLKYTDVLLLKLVPISD